MPAITLIASDGLTHNTWTRIMCNVNLTLSIDEKLLDRAREKLRAAGKTVNQEIREHLQHLAGGDDQLEADLKYLEETSGTGDSKGWKWNREDAYKRD
jgi:hypothetical protein